jgi:hypothetical protein
MSGRQAALPTEETGMQITLICTSQIIAARGGICARSAGIRVRRGQEPLAYRDLSDGYRVVQARAVLSGLLCRNAAEGE